MECLPLNALIQSHSPFITMPSQTEWKITCKEKKTTPQDSQWKKCKMAGQLVDFTEHHFPPCSANDQSPSPPLPSPNTRTQTIHSHSLPCQMGIQQLRLERRLRLKTILMLLQIKLHRLDEGLPEWQFKTRFTFPLSQEKKVTLKDKMGVG